MVDPYKEGLQRDWGIRKFNLDDLYVRFFRIAERRIAEGTGRGIVCFISNHSWLWYPSYVVMRKRLLAEFDRIWVDNLNGDRNSRPVRSHRMESTIHRYSAPRIIAKAFGGHGDRTCWCEARQTPSRSRFCIVNLRGTAKREAVAWQASKRQTSTRVTRCSPPAGAIDFRCDLARWRSTTQSWPTLPAISRARRRSTA